MSMDTSELKNFFSHDEFARRNGITIEEIRENEAVVSMTVGPDHLNAGGACQGGAIFTLGDLAVAVAGNTKASCVSVSSSIQFIRAGKPGDKLTATARVVADHKKLPTAETIVRNQNDEVVAVMTAMLYVVKSF